MIDPNLRKHLTKFRHYNLARGRPGCPDRSHHWVVVMELPTLPRPQRYQRTWETTKNSPENIRQQIQLTSAGQQSDWAGLRVCPWTSRSFSTPTIPQRHFIIKHSCRQSCLTAPHECVNSSLNVKKVIGIELREKEGRDVREEREGKNKRGATRKKRFWIFTKILYSQ